MALTTAPVKAMVLRDRDRNEMKFQTWPLFVAAIFLAGLAGCNTMAGRFLASAVNPADSQGLGTFACLRDGFDRAGFNNVSNRSLAMMAVVAKLHHSVQADLDRKVRDKAALTDTLQAAVIYGACDKKVFPFVKEMDAVQSETWISTPVLKEIDTGRYQEIFEMDSGVVMFPDKPSKPWGAMSSEKKLSLWTRLAGFHPAAACALPFAEGDKKKICEAVISSCGLDAGACNEPGEEEVQ
jgi:hypothetical protein